MTDHATYITFNMEGNMSKINLILIIILLLTVFINADFKYNNFIKALKSGNIKQIEKLADKVDINKEDENGNTPFNYLIQYFESIPNNSEIFNLLVKAGADINSKDKSGNTPLINAINNENNELTEKLVKAGVDVNIKDEKGISPLYYSILKDNKKLFDLLIEKGADFNEADKYGGSLLFIIPNQNEYYFKKLIQLSANINKEDKNGTTLLLNAITAQSSVEFIQVLLDNNADPNTLDQNGGTPLFYALYQGNYKLIDLLIKYGADVNFKFDIFDETLLIYFIKNIDDIIKRGNLTDDDVEQIIRVLIKNGLNVNKKETLRGNSALKFAVMKLDLRSIKLLVKYGADVNDKNYNNLTAMHELFFTKEIQTGREKSSGKHLEILKFLIKSGANVNAFDKSKSTPIFYAGSYPEAVDLLIKNGAKINLKNYEGTSPLMNACSSYNGLESVKLLLKNGANINEKNDNNCTPLTFASISGDDEVTKYLLEKGAKSTGNELLEAIKNENYQKFDELIKRRKYTGDELGAALLYIIHLKKGKVDQIKQTINVSAIMQKIINESADINRVIHYEEYSLASRNKLFLGTSILTMSVIFGLKDTVKDLVDKGADIEAKDFLDIEYNNFEFEQIFKDPDRESVAEWAKEKGDKEIIEILEKGNIWDYVENGNIDKVKEFCKNNRRYINIEKYYPRETLLSRAIIKDHYEIVKLLIDSGVNAKKTKFGVSYAVSSNNTKIVKMLLDAKLNPNIKSEYALHSIILAAANNNIEIVKLLLNAGANVNARDGDGNTAYSYAVKNENIEMQKLLLKYGAKKTKFIEGGA